ncbi:MAG TPA: CHAP domain-containing protein [Candidatus Saccharimonadales bacterium]|nr:CHAP domain-containing protein [Candidatus Saccharimonadales bacterium]
MLKSKLPKTIAIGVCAALVALASPVQLTKTAHADRYDDQIRALQAQMAPLQQKANELNEKANTLQAAVDALTAEKNAIQVQIDLSQAKYDKLTHDIEENKKKLAANQETLGAIIANLYVDDSISPLEMLASSKNVSDYMDKQEYRTAASEKLNTTISNIKELKVKLEEDQKAVAKVIAEQRIQREAKAAKEAEQQQLLNQTRGEEAAYQQLTAQKKTEIESLRTQQAAEIRARASSGGGYRSLPGDPNRGGYPAEWMNASMNWCSADPWGMCKRQCVSYAAFKVDQAYGNMPFWGGRGNANQWDDNARAAGFPVSSVPKAGTVGVVNDGTYGHVAWVESVNGDGTLTISQFNANWSGEYSRWVVSPSFFDVYIYFGG